MPHSNAKQYERSSRREEYAEYVLLGLLVQEAWKRDVDLTILRSQTDADGYDIVFETDEVTRHVQLKTSGSCARTASQKISLKLAGRPSGCVVWMVLNPATLDLDHILWFGGAPGRPLPDLGDRVARHTRANAEGRKAERINHRVVAKGRFAKLANASALFKALFGCSPE